VGEGVDGWGWWLVLSASHRRGCCVAAYLRGLSVAVHARGWIEAVTVMSRCLPTSVNVS